MNHNHPQHNTRKNTIGQLVLPLSFGLLALLPAYAWAGQWVLDGYQYTVAERNDTQMWHADHGTGEGPFTRNLVVTPSESHYLAIDQYQQSLLLSAEAYLGKGEQYGGLVGGPYTYKPASAYIHVLVTPVFKWVPNQIGDGYGEETHPDPNDKPTSKLWYWESSELSASRHHGIGVTYLYPPDHPYDGHHWTVTEFANGLNSERETHPQSPPEGYGVIGDTANGSGVVQCDTYGHTQVPGLSRLIKAKVEATSDALLSTEIDEETSASVGLNYTVTLPTFRLETLPQAGRIPGNVGDFQFNVPSSSQYSDIAAGGLTTDLHEHKADVAMQVLRPGPWNTLTPVSGIKRKTLPRLRLSRHEGVKVQGSLQQNLNTQTDDDGRLLAGVYTSRDLTNNAPTTTLAYIPKLPNPPGVYFVQHWSDPVAEQWKSQDPDQTGEAWNRIVVFDKPQTITYKPRLNDTIPITKHTMHFIVKRIRVIELDQATNRPIEKIYTTNPDEIQFSTEANITYVNQDWMNDYVQDFFHCDPVDVKDNNDGIYQAQVRVDTPATMNIEELTLGAEDQGTYKP